MLAIQTLEKHPSVTIYISQACIEEREREGERKVAHLQSTQEEDPSYSELLRWFNLGVPHYRHRQDEERDIGDDVRARGDNQEDRQIEAAPVRFPSVFRPVVRRRVALEGCGEEGTDAP